MKSPNLLVVAQAALAIALVVLAMAVVVPPPRSSRVIASRNVTRPSRTTADEIPDEGGRWRDESLTPSERAAAALARFDGPTRPRTARREFDAEDRESEAERIVPEPRTEPRTMSRGQPKSRRTVERIAERGERTFDAPPRRDAANQADEDGALPPSPPLEPLAPVEVSAEKPVTNPISQPRSPRIELGPVDDSIQGHRYSARAVKTFSTALSANEDDRWVNMRIVVEQPESRPVAAAVPPGPSPSDVATTTRLDARLDVLKSQLEALGREQEVRQQLHLERSARMLERNQYTTQLLEIERRMIELRTEVAARKAPNVEPKPEPAPVEERPVSPDGQSEGAANGASLPQLQPVPQPVKAPGIIPVSASTEEVPLPEIAPGPRMPHRESRLVAAPGGPYGSGATVLLTGRREHLPHPIAAPNPPLAEQPLEEPEELEEATIEQAVAVSEEVEPAAPAGTMIDPIPDDLFGEQPQQQSPISSNESVQGAALQENATVPAPRSAPDLPTATTTGAIPEKPVAGPQNVDNQAIAKAQYHRARQVLAQGNPAQARRHLDRAVELDPQLPDAQRLGQEIDAALRKPQRTLFNWPLRSR